MTKPGKQPRADAAGYTGNMFAECNPCRDSQSNFQIKGLKGKPECFKEGTVDVTDQTVCAVPNEFGPKCCKDDCLGMMGCTTCGADAKCKDDALMPKCAVGPQV